MYIAIMISKGLHNIMNFKNIISTFKRKFNIKDFLVVCLVLLVCFIFLVTIYECPTLYFLGIHCQLCGMSRAFFSLAKLDISAAFYYHPLFPLVILIVIYEFIKWLEVIKPSLKVNIIVYGIAIFLIILVFILRHIAGSDVVAIDFSAGKLF